MIKISEPTQQDYDRGYQMCPQCMREIADIDDFKTADGVRILSK